MNYLRTEDLSEMSWLIKTLIGNDVSLITSISLSFFRQRQIFRSDDREIDKGDSSKAMICRETIEKCSPHSTRVNKTHNDFSHKLSDLKTERTAVPRHKQGDRVLVDFYIRNDATWIPARKTCKKWLNNEIPHTLPVILWRLSLRNPCSGIKERIFAVTARKNKTRRPLHSRWRKSQSEWRHVFGEQFYIFPYLACRDILARATGRILLLLFCFALQRLLVVLFSFMYI